MIELTEKKFKQFGRTDMLIDLYCGKLYFGVHEAVEDQIAGKML